MVNLTNMLQVILNFLVLMAILTYLLYKPVRNFMAERSAGIERTINESQKAREEAERLRTQYQAELANARTESQKVIDEAVKQGQKVREQITQEAREEAARLMAKAKADIEQEVAKAMAMLRTEVADLAIRAAGMIIDKELDSSAHRHLVAQTLEEMESHD
jgi:F-type H+-transporting ATPase subunit b